MIIAHQLIGGNKKCSFSVPSGRLTKGVVFVPVHYNKL